jgi:transcriptional regulator with XRE-family HTH domain
MASRESEYTERPFAEAFAALKDVSGKSFRQITSELQELEGRGLSPSFLSALANGLQRPGPQTMANLAQVFGKQPTYFAEYRLAQLRALLDEGGEAGLGGALTVARTIRPELRDQALEVDPTQYPHAAPAGAGPAMRPQRRPAAA